MVIEIDLPGFRKEDINIRIIGRNILSIKVTRKRTAEEQEPLQRVYLRQRPVQMVKKIVLPIPTNEAERVTGAAKHMAGVVTLRIPIPEASKNYSYHIA